MWNLHMTNAYEITRMRDVPNYRTPTMQFSGSVFEVKGNCKKIK
jgi:hypothetical protein